MNILWLSHLVPYPPKGGVLQRSYNLLRETAKRHDVYLLAFVQRDLLRMTFSNVDAGRKEAEEALRALCRHVRFIDIPCERTRFGRQRLALTSTMTRDPYTINWLKSPEMMRAIEQLKTRVTFHLVHFDTISLAPYRSLFPGQKKTLDHHNIESHMMLRRARLEQGWARRAYFWQEGLRLRRYEKQVCPEFDLNITCSAVDSERLRAINSAICVEDVPNGVDVDYFRPGKIAEQATRRLVFAGGLNWYPNRAAMIYFARDVWPMLKATIPDVSMDLIGSAPPQELLALAARDQAYKVHGFVPDVRPFLDRAAVYVCPITDGGGTKLKILDAFAMAKATVAHPIACEGIDITPERNVLLATNAAEYVAKIADLLGDHAKRRAVGAAARRLVMERYAYETIGERLSHAYCRTWEGSSPPPAALCDRPLSGRRRRGT